MLLLLLKCMNYKVDACRAIMVEFEEEEEEASSWEGAAVTLGLTLSQNRNQKENPIPALFQLPTLQRPLSRVIPSGCSRVMVHKVYPWTI